MNYGERRPYLAHAIIILFALIGSITPPFTIVVTLVRLYRVKVLCTLPDEEEAW